MFGKYKKELFYIKPSRMRLVYSRQEYLVIFTYKSTLSRKLVVQYVLLRLRKL
jgi:hypothetical protein